MATERKGADSLPYYLQEQHIKARLRALCQPPRQLKKARALIEVTIDKIAKLNYRLPMSLADLDPRIHL